MMSLKWQRCFHGGCLVVEMSILIGVIGWGIYNTGISDCPETIKDPSEFRMKIREGQENLVKRFLSFSVYYSTASNPNRWTDPSQRFTVDIRECGIDGVYRHPLLSGVQGFRLEFNPRPECLGVHSLPKLEYILLNDRQVRDAEIREYYEERVGKPSYNVELMEHFKGRAGLCCIFGSLAVLIICAFVCARVCLRGDEGSFQGNPIP